jgi:hypothetical protein
LVVNGIPTLPREPDVIPFDSFSNRVTPENYRHIFQSARDSKRSLRGMKSNGTLLVAMGTLTLATASIQRDHRGAKANGIVLIGLTLQ